MTMVCASFALLLGLGVVSGQESPVIPYDSLLEDRVSIDGYVDREEEEYPAELKNPETGLVVSWGFDDSLLYLALETRGKGWFGLGIGAPGMDGSNMLVAYYTEDSADLWNLVGKEKSHVMVGTADSLLLDWDIDFDDETGLTTVEVAYPLKWQGDGAPENMKQNEVLKGCAIPGLEPADSYDLLLAQNTKSISLKDKHSHRCQLKVRLAEGRPKPSPEEGEK